MVYISEAARLSKIGSSVRIGRLLLYAHQLVVLAVPLRSARSTCLEVACAKGHGEVCQEAVFSLTTAVGAENSPVVLDTELVCCDGFGNGANLIHFEEHGICGLLLQALCHDLWVSAVQVVPNNLNLVSDASSERSMGIKVILVAGVFQEVDRILGGKIHPPLHQICTCLLVDGLLLIGGLLEVEVVLPRSLVKGLGCCRVGANDDLVLVSCLVNGGHEQLQSILWITDAWSKAAFIANSCGINAILCFDEALESVVCL